LNDPIIPHPSMKSNRISLLAPLRRPLLGLLAAACAGLLALAPVQAHAQDAAAAKGGTPDKTVLQVLEHSSPAVWVCVLLSVIVTGFAIEGFLKLRVTFLAPAPQLAKLRELIRGGAYQDAWVYCSKQNSFLATVVGAGLERIGRGPDAVEYTLEETSSQQAVLLKTNMNYLSVIGVVAPMIGLTGTVIGMIRAFQALGASGIGDPSALAAAIGEVLTATAAGLIVAIPGFVFYYVFKSKAQTAVMLADASIYRLFENVPYDHLSGVVVGQDAGLAVSHPAPAPYADAPFFDPTTATEDTIPSPIHPASGDA